MVPIPGAQRFLDHSTLPPSGRPDQATLLALAQAHGCPRAVGRVTHRSQLVEAGEELVEGHDQLLGRALGRQAGEALDVSKQDAGEMGGEEPVREEGRGDTARPIVSLRMAAGQHEPWGSSHRCSGGDKVTWHWRGLLRMVTSPCWLGNIDPGLLSVPCYAGGKGDRG